MRENLASLDLEARSTVIAGPALLSLAAARRRISCFSIRPTAQEREYAAALELLSQAPPALTVVQHSIRMHLGDSFGKSGPRPHGQTRRQRIEFFQLNNRKSFSRKGPLSRGCSCNEAMRICFCFLA